MGNLYVKNPYSQEVLADLSFAKPEEISRCLEAAVTAFQKWRRSPAWERSQLLNAVASRLEAEGEEFASLICQEAGKPIRLARIEVERAVGVLRWAAAEAQRFGGELLRLDAVSTGRPGFGIHTRFPRGVVLGITPFNFPLNLAIHKVAPAVASGCSIVVKPSPYTPLTAQRMAQLFESEVPGLVQVCLADDFHTEALTRSPDISMISFTGSSRIGWKIRQQAPEKPTTLELGGNAWIVLLEDTPSSALAAIANRITGAAFGYAGQSCISVQNVAASTEIWDEFKEHLSAATEKTPYGDPDLPESISGPVIHQQAADRIQKLLSEFEAGSGVVECVTSQKKMGSWVEIPTVVPPTLLVFQERPTSYVGPLVQEEIFGPVMTARKFEDLNEVIREINSSRYGLQAGVYTQNWAAIQLLYEELQVGGVVVNDVPTTRYDHQPYGGVKDSGQGREGIRYAMEEMTESKFLALSSQWG